MGAASSSSADNGTSEWAFGQSPPPLKMESICVEIDDHYDQAIIAALVMKPRTAVLWTTEKGYGASRRMNGQSIQGEKFIKAENRARKKLSFFNAVMKLYTILRQHRCGQRIQNGSPMHNLDESSQNHRYHHVNTRHSKCIVLHYSTLCITLYRIL